MGGSPCSLAQEETVMHRIRILRAALMTVLLLGLASAKPAAAGPDNEGFIHAGSTWLLAQ